MYLFSDWVTNYIKKERGNYEVNIGNQGVESNMVKILYFVLYMYVANMIRRERGRGRERLISACM